MDIMNILEGIRKNGYRSVHEKKFLELKSQLQSLADKKIALYGTGNHTKILLEYISDFKLDIIGLIDKDKSKIGTIIYEYRVYEVEEIKDKVNVIIISSDIFQETIYERIKYLEDENINILKIYEKEDLFITERTYFHDDKELGVTATCYYTPSLLSHINRYMWALNFVYNKEVLDIACGCGYGTQILSDDAKCVIGADIDKTTIEYANKYFKLENNNFICSDVESLSINKKFDVIVSFETIEHIKDEDCYINQIKKHLNDNSIFIVSTPAALKNGANNEFNSYHINEYTEKRFKEFLTSNFKKVRFYVQDEKENGAISFREAFEELDSVNYTIIAVCYNS